jgi:hypothetical protein
MQIAMKNLSRTLILLFTLALLPTMVKAADGEWKKVMEQEGVIVYSSTVTFLDRWGAKHETVLFRFENTNAYDVEISFYLEAWYGERCRSCGATQPNDYNRKFKLKAGQIISGSAQSGDPALTLHSGYPDKPGHSMLTRFNLASFTVTR